MYDYVCECIYRKRQIRLMCVNMRKTETSRQTKALGGKTVWRTHMLVCMYVSQPKKTLL